MIKKNYTIADIYCYLVITIFFTFTAIFTIYFYDYVLSNNNVLFFLLFLYLNFLLLIFFIFKIKNYIIINSIFFSFLFIFAFEGYLQIGSGNYNNHNKKDNVFNFIQKNPKKNYIPIVYPRSILETEKNYKIKDQEFIPLSGISRKRTVLCNESNFWNIYNSDRHGFNNNDDLWDKKIKLIVFGDSFSHGNCVYNQDQWVNKLKKTIPNTLNLSMGGNGPLLTMATIREYFEIMMPEIIIWQYFESHENRIPLEKKNSFLKKYFQDKNFKQDLYLKREEVDVYLQKFIKLNSFVNTEKKTRNLEQKSKFTLLKSIIRLDYTRQLFGVVKINYNLLENDLDGILQKTDEFINRRAEKYFLYIPTYQSVISGKQAFYNLDKKKIFNIALKNNFKIISADLLLKNYSNPKDLYPGKDLHFNKKGYDLVFKAVRQCLDYYNKNINSNFCEPN